MAKEFGRAAALVVAALALAGAGRAADPQDCAKTPCRDGGFTVEVRVDDRRYVPVPVTHSPYVLADGSLEIYPGETLVFRLPLMGDKIGVPEFVAAYVPEMPAERVPPAPPASDLPKLKGGMPADVLAAFPEGSFIVSYGQFQGRAGMNLVMMHNFAKTVKLDAVMSIVKQDGYEPHPTSTCPPMPKVAGIENWPHPIGPMILKNIRILPDGANMVCD